VSSAIAVVNTTIASRIPELQDLWDITLGCEDVPVVSAREIAFQFWVIIFGKLIRSTIHELEDLTHIPGARLNF